MPEPDLATIACGQHAAPSRRPLAWLEQHRRSKRPPALGHRLDLLHLHVRKPDRPPCTAFDDPAIERAAKGQPVDKLAVITPVLVTKENASKFLQ